MPPVPVDTPLAHAALARFGVHPRFLKRLAEDVLRVDAEDGKSFALRMRPIADRVFGNIPLELAWMAALRSETLVEPPESVPGLDGAAVQEVDGNDCVLFRWIPGVELAKRLTAENAGKLPVRALDRLLRGAEREVLFEGDYCGLLPAARLDVFRSVAERYAQVVDALYADPAGRRVIHSDLHHENVKVYRGRLRPLDFYEAIWGYPVQDVALTLYDLRHFARGGPAIEDAFRRGYESRLPWPETHPGQVETLIAGRRLRTANWIVEHEVGRYSTAQLTPFFERLEAELRALP